MYKTNEGQVSMNEFWALLGQIFIIVIAQSLLEKLISDKVSWAPQIITFLCYGASLYLVMRFVFENFFPEIEAMFRGVTWNL
jgi:hypothetical protein